jgi:hypothetical protein
MRQFVVEIYRQRKDEMSAIFVNHAAGSRYLKYVEKGVAGLVSPAFCGVDPQPLSIRIRVRPTAMAAVRVHCQTVAWVNQIF